MAQGPGMIEYLEAALRGTAARQAVIANNLANLHTPGYRRSEVHFEQVLDGAMERDKPVDVQALVAEIVQPRSETLNEYGNDVNLDVEVGDMVKNVARYKTYVKLLNRKYRAMEQAMQTQ